MYVNSANEVVAIRNSKDWRDFLTSLKMMMTSLSPPPDMMCLYVFANHIPLRVFDIVYSNFTDKNQLGKGGDGRVYKASLTVAVKQMEKKRDKLKNRIGGAVDAELDVPFRCDHPNILNVYGYGLSVDPKDESLYVLMVLSDFSMEKLLMGKVREQFKGCHYHDLCVQMARGLNYLHNLGIGHADLKLENVLLKESQGKLCAVLADFGRSRDFSSDSLLLYTNDRHALTTVPYCAPEAFEGQRNLKSDVYTFGMIVLELFAGKRVDVGKEFALIMGNIVMRFDDQVDKHMKNLPPEYSVVKDVILKCWAKDPSSRLSAQEALDLLESLSAHFDSLSPLSAPPPYDQIRKPITAWIRSLEQSSKVSPANVVCVCEEVCACVCDCLCQNVCQCV